MTATTAPSGLAAVRRLFGPGRFRLLFAAVTASTAAQWMQRVAFGWLLWQMEGSGALLGLLAVAELVPGIALSPLGGVLADSMDRRRLAAITQAIALLQALVAGAVILSGHASPAIILLLTAIGGSASALGETARTLLQRDAAPADCLTSAVSLASVSVNVTRFLGPAIAGGVMQVAGPASIFWINALVAGFLMLVLLRQPPRPVPPARMREGTLRALAAGVRIAADNRLVLRVLAAFAATAFIVRPIYELLPAAAAQLVDGQVQDYLSLVMAVGVGALAGAVLATLHTRDRPFVTFMGSSLVAGIALAGIALAHSLPQALAACATLGFFLSIGAARSQLILITEIADEARGRVLSLWNMLVRGGPGLGALALGGVVDGVGLRPALLGAVVLALVAVCAVFAIRAGDSLSDPLRTRTEGGV